MYPQTPYIKHPELLNGFDQLQDSTESTNYLKWLTTTPQITTYRVNLLRNNVEEAKKIIEHKILEANGLDNISKNISIGILTDFPEVIFIKSNKSVTDVPQIVSTRKEIIVDASCAAAVLRGAHIYAPGVINMLSGTKLDEIVNVFADLAGTCKKGANKPHQSNQNVFIGIGQVKMQRYQLFNTKGSPSGVAIRMLDNVSNVPCLGSIFSSLNIGILQNLPSIVCGRVLDPQENDTVLDMCAAPGNKTTHIADLMNDRGRIIALDKSPARVRLLESNINEHGATCVQCYAFDGTKAVRIDDGINEEKSINGPPFNEETFDRILLDAPCSGLGNRPILATTISCKEQRSYPNIQRKLFIAAIRLLKVGGVLVYSTCTIFPSENEEIVAWALQKYGDIIELLPAEPLRGGFGWANTGLSDEQRQLVQRFGPMEYCNRAPSPSEIFADAVGFFIAKFGRKTK